MNHAHVVEHRFVEQYLLREMSPELRDQFEEHFFDCQECVAELRATSAFLDSARIELQKPTLLSGTAVPSVPLLRDTSSNLLGWRTVAALAALAACLVVVAYQNAVTVPRLRSDVARLEMPEVLPSLSLVGGNSRGGGLPSVTRNGAHSLLLQFDIPAEERFISYTCSLYSPQHELVWSVQVSAAEAKDTISIRVPLGSNVSGTYSLTVRGNQLPGAQTTGNQTPTGDSVPPKSDLAIYSFTINNGIAGGGR